MRTGTCAILGLIWLCGAYGCASSHSDQAATTLPADKRPQLSEVVMTSQPPLDAINKVAIAFRDLGLTWGEGDRGTYFPDGASDYFSAGEAARMADDSRISVHCQWKQEGKTEVTIHSNLPANEFKLVVGRIRASLEGGQSASAADH